MNYKYWILLIVSVLIVSFITYDGIFVRKPIQSENLDVFVGVDAAYDNLEEIKRFVDETSSYTNTFVIGSTGITYDAAKLNDASQYIYDKGMYFMIYMHPNPEQLDEQRQWVEDARIRWGQRFLGLYLTMKLAVIRWIKLNIDYLKRQTTTRMLRTSTQIN